MDCGKQWGSVSLIDSATKRIYEQTNPKISPMDIAQPFGDDCLPIFRIRGLGTEGRGRIARRSRRPYHLDAHRVPVSRDFGNIRSGLDSSDFETACTGSELVSNHIMAHCYRYLVGRIFL